MEKYLNMAIEIRRAELSDARAIKEIYHCKNAYSSTLQLPHPSLKLWETRSSDTSDHIHAFVALLNNEIVGNLTFELCTNPRRRHVASFGMGVKDDMSGQGIGSALLSTAVELADKWLNIRRIEITVYVDNQSAITLYKKFGFEIEGESPDYAFRNGEFVSAYHMARIVKKA